MLRPVGRFAVEREEAIGLLVDHSGIANLEPVASRRERRGEGQRRGLMRRVEACRPPPRDTIGAANGYVAQAEFLGVERQSVGPLDDVEIDRDLAVELQAGSVGRDLDRIMTRDRGPRQLRHAGFDRVLNRPRGLSADASRREQHGSAQYCCLGRSHRHYLPVLWAALRMENLRSK